MKFNPSIIRTDYGRILENFKEEISYIYDRNEEIIKEKKDFYIVYSFFMKNVMIESERVYTKLQELFSKIGGIFNFAQIFAFYINYFYNSYICLTDTQMLLHNLIQSEKSNINSNRNLFKKLANLNDNEDNSKNQKEKTKKDNNSSSRINEINESNIKEENNLKNKNPSNSGNTYIQNIDTNKIKNLVLNNENNETKLKNSNSSFYKFLLYQFCCNKKNTYFDVYSNFRTKIISEEHLIRNHLNIYHLIKLKGKKGYRIKKKNSYNIRNIFIVVI